MRSALASAVQELLRDSRLAGQSPLVKLAAVVLLAKAPVTSAVVDMAARDVGGWLGCSISHVAHTLVPDVKKSDSIMCATKRAEDGRAAALRFELLPLREARTAAGGTPLGTLTKRELATLLRFCEAVTCPGWTPKDKPATPAGFMASRRKRGAATDRLAMLLLCLEARADGRVRMAPGRLAQGVRRADVTVARLMGCEVNVAAAAVDRLVAAGDLLLEGEELGHGGRLRVPAITAAHARVRKVAPLEHALRSSSLMDELAQESSPCPRCAGTEPWGDELVLSGEGWTQESLEDLLLPADDGAFRDQPIKDPVKDQASVGLLEQADTPASADLHSTHPPVVALGGSGAASSGFSGEAVSGSSALPERARKREDELTPGGIGAADEPGGWGGPLRGEQQPNGAGEQQADPGSVVARQVPLRWSLPRGLERVLDPVRLEWARIGHAGGRTRVRVAVKAELRRLAGIVGPEQAPVVLAERLGRRLAAQRGEPVREPVGWLLARGLPQRAECYATACDDQVRMDTGLVCPSCELLIGDRRALRHQVAQAVAAELPRLAPAEAQAEVERRLSREVALRAAQDAVRRERAVGERARREVAWARQREELAAVEAELAARACEGCGVPEAGGLCLVCSQVRTAGELVERAAQVAAAVGGPVQDLGVVAERLAACRVRLEGEAGRVAGRLRREGMPEAAVAWEARNLAEQLLREERARAVDALLGSGEVRAEGERVFAVEARRGGELQARAAAEQARQRCAELLLSQRLGQVRAADRPPAREGAGGWRERLAELAARPLEGGVRVPQPAAGGGREAVGAA